MRNNDKLTRDEIRGNIQQAVKDGDTEAFTKSFDQMILCIQEDIWQRAETQIDEMRQAADNRILSERGVRQLTKPPSGIIIRRLSPQCGKRIRDRQSIIWMRSCRKPS